LAVECKMRNRTKARGNGIGFTLIELLVVIAVIGLLMSILVPALNKVRRQSKRIVCFNNMRQLTVAWTIYADTYGGKLVNGGQSWGNTPQPKEPYWCTPVPPLPATDEFGTFPAIRFDWDITILPYEERVSLLKKGALFPYVKEVKIYRCPEAGKNFHRSYLIVQSMNASWEGAKDLPIGQGLVVRSIGGIKRAAQRVVFIEERFPTADAMIVPFKLPQWTPYDRPGCMHETGANLGFSDGHGEYWKWECQETLDYCKNCDESTPSPDTTNCKKDIIKVQRAVWGELGYTPEPGWE